MILWNWIRAPIEEAALRVILSRPHDYQIGPDNDTYLKRWYLTPKWSFLRVYIQEFLRSDDDRAVHDHPSDHISIMLYGYYDEVRPLGNPWVAIQDNSVRRTFRDTGAVVYRRAENPHRVELIDGASALTLLIVLRQRRIWGFWCPGNAARKASWVPFFNYLKLQTRGNEVGDGC